MDNKITSKTIVFVHGMFQNPRSWEKWKTYFEARGYTCHAPPYPFHGGDPSDLRKNIHVELGKLTFGQVVESLATFIDQLPEKPILIGHSMGGLAVQKLLEMDSTSERLRMVVAHLSENIRKLEQQRAYKEVMAKVRGNGDLGRPHKEN